MLLNESPKSNPVPLWKPTVTKFIWQLAVSALIYIPIYLLRLKGIFWSLLGLCALVLGIRSILWFVIKVSRMNIESRKRK